MDKIFGTLNIPNLSDEELETVSEALKARKLQNKSREKYKTVYEEKHVYENGELVVRQEPRVVKYTDTSIPDADGKCDSNMSLSDRVKEKVPELKEVKRDNKGKAVTSLEKCTPSMRLAEFKGKNIALRYAGGGTWVNTVDFYTDLYSYPDDFDDKFKGELAFTLKDNSSRKRKKAADSSEEKKAYPVVNATVAEISSITLRDRDDVITYVCDWFPEYVDDKGIKHIKPDTKHVRNVFALCVDIDYVLCGNLCNFIENDWNLEVRNRDNTVRYERFVKPTYIVNSGHGLHLYYVLDKPVPYFKKNKAAIDDLYVAMQAKYNTFKTKGDNSIIRPFELSGKFQSCYGIAQAFRAVGTKTKLGTHVSVVKYGEKFSIDSLFQYFGLEEAIGTISFHGDIDDNFANKKSYYKKVDYVKHIEGKKLSKAEYALNCLLEDIPCKTKNLYGDIRVFAMRAKSAGKDLDYVHESVASIVRDYAGLHSDKEISLERYDTAAVKSYEETSVNQYIQRKMSYKVLKHGNMATGLYQGILEKCFDKVWVGNRYMTIMALGYLAVRCGISKEQYLKDMEAIYNNILYITELNGFESFTEDDYQQALKAADDAFIHGRMAKTKTIENWLGWRYTTDNPKTTYVKKKKTPDEMYVFYTLKAIVFLMAIEVGNKKCIEKTMDINGNPETVYFVKFPSITDIVMFSAVHELGEDGCKYYSNYNFVKRYYSTAIEKYREMCMQNTGMDNVAGTDGQFVGFYEESLLSPIDKVRDCIQNKGITTTNGIVAETGLSKPTVIKYKRLIEQETAE